MSVSTAASPLPTQVSDLKRKKSRSEEVESEKGDIDVDNESVSSHSVSPVVDNEINDQIVSAERLPVRNRKRKVPFDYDEASNQLSQKKTWKMCEYVDGCGKVARDETDFCWTHRAGNVPRCVKIGCFRVRHYTSKFGQNVRRYSSLCVKHHYEIKEKEKRRAFAAAVVDRLLCFTCAVNDNGPVTDCAVCEKFRNVCLVPETKSHSAISNSSSEQLLVSAPIANQCIRSDCNDQKLKGGDFCIKHGVTNLSSLLDMTN